MKRTHIRLLFLLLVSVRTNLNALPEDDLVVTGTYCLPANTNADFTGTETGFTDAHIFKSLWIKPGATLTVCGTGDLYIKVLGEFKNEGTIDLSGKGVGSGPPNWLTNLANSKGYNLDAGQSNGGGGFGGGGIQGGGYYTGQQPGSAGGAGGNGGSFLRSGTMGDGRCGRERWQSRRWLLLC